MTIERIRTTLRSAAQFFRDHFSTLLCIAVLVVAAVVTFQYQNRVVGWEPGYDELQPKHHGWVTSQGLAIITSATPENHFVGFAEEYKDENDVLHYDYFDRYPVFFSAIFNQVLSLRSKLSSKIYLAKQVMNVIFLATLLVAFLLLDKLVRNKPLALVATLLAFSNPFLLFYKDMVHFDQPALLGFFLLMYAIAWYRIDGVKWPVYPAALAVVAMGRGYASYAVLLLWLAIEGILILREKGPRLGAKLVRILRHPALWVTVMAILWGAGLLSYNIVTEANKRGISVWQTSILHSAGQRLSLNSTFNEQYASIIDWGEFLKTTVNRIIQWSFPVNRVNLGFVGNLALLAAMFLVMFLAVRRKPLERRIIFLLLIFSGFFWIIPMRNLAAFHDYTTMYLIGVPLGFYISVLLLLNPSRESSHYLVLTGMVLFVSAILLLNQWHVSLAGDASEYTYDFMRITEAIEGQDNNIYLTDAVPYGPYAPKFYLQGQYLSPENVADYVISSNPNYLPDNLTPLNEHMYLFKK